MTEVSMTIIGRRDADDGGTEFLVTDGSDYKAEAWIVGSDGKKRAAGTVSENLTMGSWDDYMNPPRGIDRRVRAIELKRKFR